MYLKSTTQTYPLPPTSKKCGLKCEPCLVVCYTFVLSGTHHQVFNHCSLQSINAFLINNIYSTSKLINTVVKMLPCNTWLYCVNVLLMPRLSCMLHFHQCVCLYGRSVCGTMSSMKNKVLCLSVSIVMGVFLFCFFFACLFFFVYLLLWVGWGLENRTELVHQL